MKGQLGYFDLQDRYAQLSESGDPLERLAEAVDFEPFRYRLNKALKRLDNGKGGRPAYDPVLMFKVLILQSLSTLSDEQTEFQIRDRLSFQRILGIGVNDPVPGSGAGRDHRLAVPRAPDQGGCDREALPTVR
jgi:hypothetical protein